MKINRDVLISDMIMILLYQDAIEVSTITGDDRTELYFVLLNILTGLNMTLQTDGEPTIRVTPHWV